MPIITEAWDGDFRLLSDRSKILATMYYPSAEQVERRRHFACLEHAPWKSLQDAPLDSMVSMRVQDIHAMAYSGYVGDFSLEWKKIEAEAYFAAHWLKYRLYASINEPPINSSVQWDYYALSVISKKLPKTWQRGKNNIQDARKNYGTVAHLWLAHFEDRGFVELNPSARRPPSVRTGVAGLAHDPFSRFLRRAGAYYRAAMDFGVFDETRAKPGRDEIWQLPDYVEPGPLPAITAPSLGDAFNPIAIHEGYLKWLRRDDGEHYRAPLAAKKARRR